VPTIELGSWLSGKMAGICVKGTHPTGTYFVSGTRYGTMALQDGRKLEMYAQIAPLARVASSGLQLTGRPISIRIWHFWGSFQTYAADNRL
jgi:hypothetical protein